MSDVEPKGPYVYTLETARDADDGHWGLIFNTTPLKHHEVVERVTLLQNEVARLTHERDEQDKRTRCPARRRARRDDVSFLDDDPRDGWNKPAMTGDPMTPPNPLTDAQIETETHEFQPRTEHQLREALRTVCEVIWNGGRSKPGQHVWSIPVDKTRDFDCILGDGIAELMTLRTKLAKAEAERDTLAARIEKVRGVLRQCREAGLTILSGAEDCDDCADLERACIRHDAVPESDATYRAVLAAEDVLGPCVCGHARNEHWPDDERGFQQCETCRSFRLPVESLFTAAPDGGPR